jgi:hypothetical protein
MINFGKLHSISNLLMLIRSSQLTPYDLPISFGAILATHAFLVFYLKCLLYNVYVGAEIQCFLGRAAVFRGDDAMWERSKALE